MDLLPIKSIREEDAPFVGQDLFNLARLTQADLPVAPGIVVFPPEFKLKTVLEHFQYKQKEVFEQSLHLVKKEIAQIPAPQELESVLKSHQLESEKIWLSLLEAWLNQIRGRIWQQGFYKGLTDNLLAQPIFFTDKINSSGEAYFDKLTDQLVIKFHQGKISPIQITHLQQIVKKGDKKLFLPQIYSWVVDKSLKIVKVHPFTQHHPQEVNPELLNLPTKLQTVVSSPIKTAIKIFIDPGSSLQTEQGIDGVLLKGENILDFDQKAWQLAELATNLPNIPIIYKLADQVEKFGGVRGSLRLIHQQSLLKKEVEVFLFARNKRGLINTQVALPFVRSVGEFLQLKRDLAALKVTRKGSLKIWLELAVPENLLNLEEYLVAGFDGALINLDELASWIGGFEPQIPESVFYKKQIKALLKILEDPLKLLSKSRTPVLVTGSLTLNDEVLRFLIDKAVGGLVVSSINADSARNYLQMVEKHHLRSKLLN